MGVVTVFRKGDRIMGLRKMESFDDETQEQFDNACLEEDLKHGMEELEQQIAGKKEEMKEVTKETASDFVGAVPVIGEVKSLYEAGKHAHEGLELHEEVKSMEEQRDEIRKKLDAIQGGGS
jgi:predicted nuclease with TOPRIM domain